MAEQRIFTEHDDRFHSDEMVGDWWSTETAWFSFAHPERRLGGWFVLQAGATTFASLAKRCLYPLFWKATYGC